MSIHLPGSTPPTDPRVGGVPLAAPPSSAPGRLIIAIILIAIGLVVGINTVVGSYLLSKTADAVVALIFFMAGVLLLALRRVSGSKASGVTTSLSVGGLTVGNETVDLSSLITQLQGMTTAENMKSFVTTTQTSQTFNMNDQDANELLANGRRGSARITSVIDTGVKLGDSSLLVLELSVLVDGHAYEATAPSMVPTGMLGRAVTGASVEVRADPANLSNLAVVWS